MEISRGGGGGGRDDPGRMTPAQRHDENPERHAGRSQGRNERRKNFAAALPVDVLPEGDDADVTRG